MFRKIDVSPFVLGFMMFVVGAVFVPVYLFAQDAVPAAAGAFDPQTLFAAVFAAGLPFLVEGLKKMIPGMPRMLIWAAAPVLGATLGWIGSMMTNAAPGGWKGFALGLVAIALREAQSTFKQHGVNG